MMLPYRYLLKLGLSFLTVNVLIVICWKLLKAGDISRGFHREATNVRRNVLFIIVDDMRPEIGFYHEHDLNKGLGQRTIHTPNIDSLACKSAVFANAHVQFALCGPSRASMLIGRRPDNTRIYNNKDYWRQTVANFTTLPQYFKENGYYSLGMGKIYHRGEASGFQDPPSWSEKHYQPPYVDMHLYTDKGAGFKIITQEDRKTRPKILDEFTVDRFKSRMVDVAKNYHENGQNYFVGFGIYRPHMNLICPAENFDQYDVEPGELFMARRDWQTPEINRGCNMYNATTIAGKPRLSDPVLRDLRRAYFACISHVDDLVGQVLAELQDLGLADSTVVSLVADHGFQLGENNHVGKTTTWDTSTRVPMMVHIPGVTDKGIIVKTAVEALDLFPTLTEAAGVDTPPTCGRTRKLTCVDGRSLMSSLSDPDKETGAALSQIPHERGKIMEYSLRTSDFRFTAFFGLKGKGSGVRLISDPRGYWTELYDMREDPSEITNRTDELGYAQIKRELQTALENKVSKIWKTRMHL